MADGLRPAQREGGKDAGPPRAAHPPRREHLGPGLAAKPVVDLVVELDPGASLEEAISRLRQMGYVHEGDKGIEGREAFHWPAGEARHHLYVTVGRIRELERQIAFRDYLAAHPDVRDVYGALKQRLAARFGTDRDGYTNAKTDFIEAVLAVAGGAGHSPAP